MFFLWQSALNNTHSHCGTQQRETVRTPLGMRTAPRVEWTRPAAVRLVHPGSTLCHQWMPGPPKSPSCPQQSRQTHTDWRTPSPWSGKSKLESRRHSSDSTDSRRVTHTEPSAGLVWRTERRRWALLSKTATSVKKHIAAISLIRFC